MLEVANNKKVPDQAPYLLIGRPTQSPTSAAGQLATASTKARYSRSAFPTLPAGRSVTGGTPLYFESIGFQWDMSRTSPVSALSGAGDSVHLTAVPRCATRVTSQRPIPPALHPPWPHSRESGPLTPRNPHPIFRSLKAKHPSLQHGNSQVVTTNESIRGKPACEANPSP